MNNNNTIQPVGDISFDTIRNYFNLDQSKDAFWQEMLADFQGIYSTIDWETDKYDTFEKIMKRDENGDLITQIKLDILKQDLEQDELLEEFEKKNFVDQLQYIKNIPILKMLRQDKTKVLFQNKNYLELYNIFKPLISDDSKDRKFLPYEVKQFQRINNNKTRVPFVKGSIISSRTTANKFELVGAFKLLLYKNNKIFKVFIYKKLKSSEDGKFDYIVIFNYGDIIDFSDGIYLDCIKAICTFIITHLPANNDTINRIMLVGQSMGGNMAINTLVNLAREFNYPIDKLFGLCSAFPSCLNETNLNYLNSNLNGHYVSFMAMGENNFQDTNKVDNINTSNKNNSKKTNKLTSKNIINKKVSLNSFYYKGDETPIKTLVFLYRLIPGGFKLSSNLYSIEDVGKIDISFEGGIGSAKFHNLQLIFKGIKKILNNNESNEIINQTGGKRNYKSKCKNKKQTKIAKIRKMSKNISK